MMEITTVNYKRCSVVTVKKQDDDKPARIDSKTAPELADAFKSLTEGEDVYKIVFDMGDVGFISSAGLRVLIDVQKTCKKWNRGDLVLANVPEVIMESLDLAGFVPLFDFYDDVTAAVGSF
jgi:anti-sigma B factor antagonist